MMQLTDLLPPVLQDWVNGRLSQGRYVDAADYLRDLVRRDQEVAEEETEWLREQIEIDLASGVVDAEPENILREIMAAYPAKDG